MNVPVHCNVIFINVKYECFYSVFSYRLSSSCTANHLHVSNVCILLFNTFFWHRPSERDCMGPLGYQDLSKMTPALK